MYSINVRNVNEALPIVLLLLGTSGKRVTVRGRDTVEYPGCFSTTYRVPQERILFDPVRDANPFFHLLESLWILAGRDDVAFVASLITRMKDYSDDGRTFHGAYGHRLRNTHDQISMAVDLLTKDPASRQAVLQIWDMERDLGTASKDIPCNNLVWFKLREGKLNMTVCCRSNDVIWGAYGANVVQFSMLQEYVAGKLNCHIGEYTQISDSFHVYTDLPLWLEYCKNKGVPLEHDEYKQPPFQTKPLSFAPNPRASHHFDTDLKRMFTRWDADHTFGDPADYDLPFFSHTVAPVFYAYRHYKEDRLEQALELAECISAPDWSLACCQWLERRVAKRVEQQRERA